MRVTYLINQYPKVSHSFIRREILALERQGARVQRVAQRGWKDAVVDEEDNLEQEKTRYLVQQGPLGLLWSAMVMKITHPLRYLAAFRLTLRMMRGSDKTWYLHLIYLLEACQLARWLKSDQSTHLHAHFGTNSAEIAMLASLLSEVPYSFTVHGPEEFDKPLSLNLKTKIRHAKFVVAISSFGRSQLYRWADFTDWHKIKVVHCGLESRFYERANHIIPDTHRLVCVGRLCEQKGQMLLLEAAKQLKVRGLSFELILAGDGEMRLDVETLITKYQLAGQVRITGWISSDEVRELILASRALVLPSFAEGLPVVIMEAMSLQRPVISTYVAGIPELVESGKNGWLCVAGDVESLVDAIQEALSAGLPTLQKMGKAAHERVVERHNIDTEAAKLIQHFSA